MVAIIATPLLNAATIEGRVYDDENDLFLEGVEISIPELGRSAITQRGGEYRISGLESGGWTVIANPSGFPMQAQAIAIDAQTERLAVNFTFTEADVFMLEEMVVVGSASATMKAVNLERSATGLRDVVSSDAFGQFADRNPAEALQRIAGVTVEDDQGEGAFVIIRGASPEFSNVQIDGVELATPQPDGRRVNLNVITVDQLERIDVSKTWLPSQRGNTIGGTVNLVTRSALDRNQSYLSAEAAYTQHAIADDASYRANLTMGTQLDKNDATWLGNMRIGLQLSVNHSEDNRGSETLRFAWTPNAAYPFVGEPVFGYTLRNNSWEDFAIKRERSGTSLRVALETSPRHRFYISGSYNKFDDDEVNRFFTRSASNTGNDFNWDGNETLTENIARELGYNLNDPSVADRLSADPASSQARLTFAESIQLGQLVYDEALRQFTFGSWVGAFSRNFRNEITNDEIFTVQIGGEHSFTDALQIEWKAYQSSADRDSERVSMGFGGVGGLVQPVSGSGLPRIDLVSVGPSLDPRFFRISEPSRGQSNLISRSFLLSEDERSGANVDLRFSFHTPSIEWITRVGLAYDQREKVYAVESRPLEIATNAFDNDLYENNQIRLSDSPFFGGESDAFVSNFGDFFRFGPTLSIDGLRAFVADPAAFGVTVAPNLDASTQTSIFANQVTTNYSSEEDIFGAYFQQTAKWKALTFVFGVRWEQTSNAFTNLEIKTRNEENNQFISPGFWRFLDQSAFAEEVTREREYDNWMPAVQLRWDIDERTILRASYSETIARPKFDDIDAREVPAISGATFETAVRLPSFDLLPTESKNYDISLERYFEPLGVISVAGFYKDLSGIIYDERRLSIGPNDETAAFAEKYTSRGINSSPWTFVRKANSGPAELYGIEFSLSYRLNRLLPAALSGFTLDGNIAFFESEVRLLTQERNVTLIPGQGQEPVLLDPTVAMFEQPDKTANLSLTYERFGLFVRFSYNLRGSYLDSVYTGDDIGSLMLIGDGAAAFDRFVGKTERYDLTVRYNITRQLQVFAEAINLFNNEVEEYLGERSRLSMVRYTEPVYSIGAKFVW